MPSINGTIKYPLKCIKCVEYFTTEKKLEVHNTSIHSKDGFKCQFCQRFFPTKQGKKTHESRMHQRQMKETIKKSSAMKRSLSVENLNETLEKKKNKTEIEENANSPFIKDIVLDCIQDISMHETSENIDPLSELTLDILHEPENPIIIDIEEVDVEELPEKSDIIELHWDYMQTYINIYSC